MIWCCVCFIMEWGKILMPISGWHKSLSGLMIIMTQIFEQQLFGWNFAKLFCSFHYKVKIISIIHKFLRTSLLSAKPIAGKRGEIGIKILTIVMIWTACVYLKSHLLEISLVCLTSRVWLWMWVGLGQKMRRGVAAGKNKSSAKPWVKHLPVQV